MGYTLYSYFYKVTRRRPNGFLRLLDYWGGPLETAVPARYMVLEGFLREMEKPRRHCSSTRTHIMEITLQSYSPGTGATHKTYLVVAPSHLINI